MARKKIDIKPGDKYSRLTITKEIEPHISTSGHKARKVLCKCECGNETEVILNNLRNGNTISCGCLHKEKVLQFNITHNLSSHPLYGVWQNMKQRCYDTKLIQYKDYGGRGITVCKDWLNDLKCFYDWAIGNGWKKGLQIDRIDNDGNYEPNNCKFVTSQENSLNQRIMKNNTSGYRGVSFHKASKKWCARVSVNKKRYHIGLYSTAEQAAIAYNLFVVLNNLPNKLNII